MRNLFDFYLFNENNVNTEVISIMYNKIFIVILALFSQYCETPQEKSEIDLVNQLDDKIESFTNKDLCPKLGILNKDNFKDKYIKFIYINRRGDMERYSMYNDLLKDYLGFKVLERSKSYGASQYKADILLLNTEEFNFFNALDINNKEELRKFITLYNFLCDYSLETKPSYYNKINFVKDLNIKTGIFDKIDVDQVIILQSFDYYNYMYSNLNSKMFKVENSRELSSCGIPGAEPDYNYCFNAYDFVKEKNDFELNRLSEKIINENKNKKYLYAIKLLNPNEHGEYDFNKKIFKLNVKAFFPENYFPNNDILIPEVSLKISPEKMESILNEENNSIRILFSVKEIKNYTENSKICTKGTGGDYCILFGICKECFEYKSVTNTYRRINLSVKNIRLLDKNENILY